MEIKLYEEWMLPQIADLFSQEYGIDKQEFSKLMLNFYEHPFQKNKCIRIVAVIEQTVVGFQSFFYWPYTYNGRTFNSFQSGNSLVHPHYRGKGIFQKLLDYIDRNKVELEIDFLIGFPVEASFNSFIRNNWQNPFNLTWHIKIINPIGFLFKTKNITNYFDLDPIKGANITAEKDTFKLSNDIQFLKWRKEYSSKKQSFYFYYNESNNSILFELKFNKRNRWINEVIIGNINSNCEDDLFITKAFKSLKTKLRSTMCISILSIAINEQKADAITKAIRKSGFNKIKKQIYFIVKPMTFNDTSLTSKNWAVYRGDIDTW